MDKMQILYKKVVCSSIKDENYDDDFHSEKNYIKSQHDQRGNNFKTTRNYFEDVIEHELTEALIECVKVKPNDPIEFVADALEKYLAFNILKYNFF